jgi:hypothetical protein
MKKMLLALLLLPALSFASFYNCSGSGFNIDVTANPFEMKIVGNNINSITQNIRMSSTFDTIISSR